MRGHSERSEEPQRGTNRLHRLKLFHLQSIQRKNVERITARASLRSIALVGANAEAAARKSMEMHISRKTTAAGTKRTGTARDMHL